MESDDTSKGPAVTADSTDEELMAAWIAGNQRALAHLYRRYQPVLLRVLIRQTGDPIFAEDMVQQTFVHLHRGRKDFKAGARLRPWLFAIAMNVRRDHFRKLARRREDMGPPPPSQEPSTDGRRIDSTLDAGRVRAALQKLKPDQREVIELHWLADLPFAEVAEIVGASVGAVKVRASRGYKVLRKELEEVGAPIGYRADGDGVSPENTAVEER